MALEFMMPDVGEGLAEAEIVRWLVELGEPVKEDVPFVEIETDKAVMEMPAPRSGVLLFVAGPNGTVVEIGGLLAVIGEPGESWGDASAPQPPAPAPAEEVKPIVGSLGSEVTHIDGTRSVKTSASPRPLASPPIRKFARDAGVDLSLLVGSGPDGRILRGDVMRYLDQQRARRPSANDRVELLSARRRSIAEHLSRSWREIPHVTTYEWGPGERILEAKRRLAQRLDRQVPLEALMMKIVIAPLAEFPEFNAVVDGDEVTYRGSYNIGFSVDTPEGLLVPVVHKADTKSFSELVHDIIELKERAQGRSLRREHLEGLTFTVSNIGAIGGGFGTPIIPWGTSSILSVGRLDKLAVVREDSVVVERRLPLSLSYDHRLIDGGTGRRFMAALTAALEEPLLSLVEEG